MKRMHTDREIRALAVDSVEGKENLEVFEHIVDKDGHPRFIEGEINLTAPIEGVTLTYGKWSLSGSHLMLVLAGTIAEGTELAWVSNFALMGLPEWICDKITPVASNYIDVKSVSLYADDTTTQTWAVNLRKQTPPNKDLFLSTGTVTLSKTRGFRIQFDLLIDDE